MYVLFFFDLAMIQIAEKLLQEPSYVFSLPKFAQKIGNFRTFSLGPPFAILQKTALFDNFGKIVISRVIGVFSCGFLHNRNLG